MKLPVTTGCAAPFVGSQAARRRMGQQRDLSIRLPAAANTLKRGYRSQRKTGSISLSLLHPSSWRKAGAWGGGDVGQSS